MSGRTVLALCALALGVVAAPPLAAAQNSVEVARARQTLEHYTTCERTRRFQPCWPLLSRRIQAEWARQGRPSAAEYAEARGASEPRYADFRVLQIRRSPSRVVFVTEATRAAGPGGGADRVEYAILREGDQWKIDGRRVGPSETTP
ncbi:MAG TPA: hypothetical protein VFT36_06465 [Methylomirabilota bacterium]|nr:hypothetical protein [Methylomirabilota bacterium]